jgi:hypothetical protein
MKNKCLSGLIGASALFAALFVAELIFFVTHSLFRQTVDR